MIQQQQENLPGEPPEDATPFPEPFAVTAFPKPASSGGQNHGATTS